MAVSDPRLFQANGAGVTAEYTRDASGALYVRAVFRNPSAGFEKAFGPVLVLSEEHARQWLVSKVSKYGFPLSSIPILDEQPNDIVAS